MKLGQSIKQRHPNDHEQVLPGVHSRSRDQSSQIDYLLSAQRYKGSHVRDGQTVDVNDSRVHIFIYVGDYPLLIIARDVDPLFIMPNEVTASRLRGNLVGTVLPTDDFLQVEGLVVWYRFIMMLVGR